jgi:predicted nucleotidyltransferase
VTPDLEAQNRRIVAAVLSAVGDRVIAIYRFGSTAQRAATADSDIDVALLARTCIALASHKKPGKRSSCSNAHIGSTRVWLSA